MIGDGELKIAKLYGMLPASAGNTAAGRTPADNATVRNVYIVGPDKKIKLVISYPMTTGRNFAEVLRALDSVQLDRQAPGRDAGQLGARRRRDHRRFGLGRGREAEVPGRLEGAEALHADRAAAAQLNPRPGRPAGPRGRRRDWSAPAALRPAATAEPGAGPRAAGVLRSSRARRARRLRSG